MLTFGGAILILREDTGYILLFCMYLAVFGQMRQDKAVS